MNLAELLAVSSSLTLAAAFASSWHGRLDLFPLALATIGVFTLGLALASAIANSVGWLLTRKLNRARPGRADRREPCAAGDVEPLDVARHLGASLIRSVLHSGLGAKDALELWPSAFNAQSPALSAAWTRLRHFADDADLHASDPAYLSAEKLRLQESLSSLESDSFGTPTP
jgi:hypothetical protein